MLRLRRASVLSLPPFEARRLFTTGSRACRDGMRWRGTSMHTVLVSLAAMNARFRDAPTKRGPSPLRPLLALLAVAVIAFASPAIAGTSPSEAAYEAGIEARDAGDEEAAAEHFRRAAELGSDEAAFQLAIMYEHGRGVAASMRRAMEWYHQAAEAGNEKAQFNLAHLYATGRNMDKDAAEAAKWYRKSAEQNNPHAQFALGLMLFFGEAEVARDLVESYTWLTLAVYHFDANHFRDDAADARRHVLEQMTEEQEAEGRRRVNEHRNR